MSVIVVTESRGAPCIFVHVLLADRRSSPGQRPVDRVEQESPSAWIRHTNDHHSHVTAGSRGCVRGFQSADGIGLSCASVR